MEHVFVHFPQHLDVHRHPDIASDTVYICSVTEAGWDEFIGFAQQLPRKRVYAVGELATADPQRMLACASRVAVGAVDVRVVLGDDAPGMIFDIGDAPWAASVSQQLEKLLMLPHNWDTYGSSAIGSQYALEAVSFLQTVMKPHTSTPYVTPIGYKGTHAQAGVQVEWHQNGFDIEAYFEPSDAVDDPSEDTMMFIHDNAALEELEFVDPVEGFRSLGLADKLVDSSVSA